MQIQKLTFNPFQTNCYLLVSAGECAIVDPSCQSEAEISSLIENVEGTGARVTELLLTHAHIDHIFGCQALSQRYDLPFRLHAEDRPLFDNADQQAAIFGIPLDVTGVEIQEMDPDEAISVGNTELEIRHTPGHSPGSVVFIDHAGASVIGGDVLFQGSVGRTDLWRGSMDILLSSIRDELLTLPESYAVLPGHGPDTTIGDERNNNPFLKGQTF